MLERIVSLALGMLVGLLGVGFLGNVRSQEAEWRFEAEARIEQFRKADLRVHVTDAEGQAVEGATISVRMKRHAFGFGTAVNERRFVDLVNSSDPDERADGEVYREKIETLFNKAVLENGHKWRFWENETNDVRRPKSIETTEWLLARGIEVRGHAMIWQHKDYALPADVKDPAATVAHIRERAAHHIADIGTFHRGKLSEWDVLNEQYSEHYVTDRISPGVPKEEAPVLVEWFHAARAADPEAKLYINDFGILVSGDADHKNSYERTIAYLLEQGAPLGGIGMQGHFWSAAKRQSPEALLATLDRYARFGLPLQITEFDMFGGAWTEEIKADFMRDVMTVVFSHEAVEGFIMWGFWDGSHWQESAPLFDEDWNLKPSGQVYMDLVFEKWWTDTQGLSDAAGDFSLRGFQGDYELQVEHGGFAQTLPFTLGSGGQTLDIVIPEPETMP